MNSHGRGNAFYLANTVENARFPRHERAPLALGILLAMIVCLASGILSPVVATWLAALAMVFRLHRRAVEQGEPMKNLKGHLTFGLFYSAFREEAWWWEATVAVRKIGVAAIGVFGAAMETMQVHVTMLLVALNLVLKLQVHPYGDKEGLRRLDQWLLGCLCLTLWAGTVFNAHPRCEDPKGKQGTTLGWCDFLSVVIGLTDLCAGVIALLHFS